MISIKVFTAEGAGSAASVLSGLDFVQKAKLLYPGRPMVATLSFGTPVHLQSLHAAVAAVVKVGIIVTASAGNDARNACHKSPASMEEVITVAASTYDDGLAPFSNIGPCTDIFAPGDRITSAWRRNNFDRATISGTSAGAAHAAGVTALALEKYPRMQAAEMKANMQEFSEHNAVHGIPDGTETPNLMLNMGILALF